MVICVYNELKEIKEKLKNRGYKIISESENTVCDAIICNLKNVGLNNILKIENSINSQGILIIDSSNKTIDEIEYILNNRVYSSLI